MNRRARQRGAGIIETMIGILIGLIVMLVVYSVLTLAESYKRTTVGVAEAQTTGLFAQFFAARELSNGGAGLDIGIDDLATCNNDWTLKPIPVLITDGGGANLSDSFVVFYSTSPRVANPVLFKSGGNVTVGNVALTPVTVQTPNGLAVGDEVIVTDRVGNCSLLTITALTAPDVSGYVTLDYATTAPDFSYPPSSKLVNLAQMQRVLYTVDPAKQQLYSTDLDPTIVGAVPNPLAQNIVLMKAQYGIDNNNDGIVDFWTSANAITPGADGFDYSAAVIGSAATTATQIKWLKAVRIAMVARSDEPDLKDKTLVGQASRYLFNCSVNTDAGCQGRIKIDSGVGGILQDGYRYKIYETTVPLRNTIWNAP
ncbi:MAG TPA: PilW family protein [Casimicrobiaceae bacterium]